MTGQVLSWIVVVIGLIGFWLAGKKIWWAWYVNIACQFLWFTYGIVSEQPAFILSSIVYLIVFVRNAAKWTKERHDNETPKPPSGPIDPDDPFRGLHTS